MYDLIYNYISNILINSSLNTYGLADILSIVSLILIYVSLVKLIVWIFKYASSFLQV